MKSRTEERYEQAKIEKLIQYLRFYSEKGQPVDYEILIDNFKAVRRTNDPENFMMFKNFMTEDTRSMQVLLFSGSQVKPGIRAWHAMATETVVKKTKAIASMAMGRISDLKSCQEVLEAASYKMGGRKSKNTTSGSRTSDGNEGMKPRLKPVTTSITGFGNLSLLATARSVSRTPKTIMVISKFCIARTPMSLLSNSVFLC